MKKYIAAYLITAILGLSFVTAYSGYHILPVESEKNRLQNKYILGDIASTNDDTTDPVVTIERPKNGYLYIFDKEVLPIRGRPVIIGKFTSIVTAVDNESGIDRVEFWIGFGCHGEKRFTDEKPPYEWVWDDHSMGRRKLRVYAFDNAGNEKFAELEIIKIF